MKCLSQKEIEYVLNEKEQYYRGLNVTGSHHDKKVSLIGLLILRNIRKSFEKKIAAQD